jgi:hypothetical protein
MSATLAALVADLAAGRLKVVDLTQSLGPSTPVIAAGETRNVLYLFGPSRLLPANIEAERGLRRALGSSADRHVELYVEFLDVPRFKGESYVHAVAAFLRQRSEEIQHVRRRRADDRRVTERTEGNEEAVEFADRDFAYGGGIVNDGEFSGTATLTVSNCILNGNWSDYTGGGIYNDGGTLTINDSSVSDNFTHSPYYNGGGNIDSWILEKLLRKAWFYWQGRAGSPTWNMQYAFRGHLVVLCDERTSSDGEAFTEGFKRLGLGKVIGTRTWGGEIWLSASNWLVDRGIATAAEFGVYGPEGQWLIEGHGVEPDIVVENPPHATFKGEDAQLAKAIEYLQEEIRRKPVEIPPAPPHPDKSLK